MSATRSGMKAQPADMLQKYIILAAHLLLWVAPSRTAMLLPSTALVAKDMLAGRLWPLVHLSWAGSYTSTDLQSGDRCLLTIQHTVSCPWRGEVERSTH